MGLCAPAKDETVVQWEVASVGTEVGLPWCREPVFEFDREPQEHP